MKLLHTYKGMFSKRPLLNYNYKGYVISNTTKLRKATVKIWAGRHIQESNLIKRGDL